MNNWKRAKTSETVKELFSRY